MTEISQISHFQITEMIEVLQNYVEKKKIFVSFSRS